jgi:hypothetical protein
METAPKLRGLNRPIPLGELYATIKVMKSGKAPGEDIRAAGRVVQGMFT